MGGWKTLGAVGVAVGLVVALAGCQEGESVSGDVHKGPAGPGAVRVVMRDSSFQPGVVRVTAGSPVTLEVRNDGSKSHNLSIGSLHVSTGSMHGGEVTTVRFTAPSGTTEFRCTWHPGMTGQLVGT